MTTCPSCGQPMPKGLRYLNAAALLNLLQQDDPHHREVYRGQDGGWYVTYSGERTTSEVVAYLVRRGDIVSVYNTCPNDAYHVGRTIDMTRTMEWRKGRRKQDWKTFYVGEAA